MFESAVFCSRIQLIKNPDVSIATKSLPLYSKLEELLTSIENKKTQHQINKQRKISSIKGNNLNLFMYRTKKRKNLPTPENLSIYGVKGWVGL